MTNHSALCGSGSTLHVYIVTALVILRLQYPLALSKVRPFAAAGIAVFVWSKSVPASFRERAIAVRFGIAMIQKDPYFFARIYGEMYVSQL